ncbi:MAG: TolB family protein [Candidatus Binatia bacterium]
MAQFDSTAQDHFKRVFGAAGYDSALLVPACNCQTAGTPAQQKQCVDDALTHAVGQPDPAGSLAADCPGLTPPQVTAALAAWDAQLARQPLEGTPMTVALAIQGLRCRSAYTVDIHTIDADTSTSAIWRDEPNPPDSNAPEWSGDGSQIVFWSGFESRFGEVWVMNADGTNRQQLTNTTDPMNSDNPAWSPDGTKIVFDSNRSGPGTVGIWLMDADGANPHLLTSGSGQTSWQPVVGPSNEPFPDVVGVPARSLVMKDDSQGGMATKRRFRLRVRTMQEQMERRVVPPARGSAGDPRVNGAVLTVYNSAGSSEAVTVALPPAAWQALGTESNPRGYRFRDQSRTGPVQRVVVKPDIIRITAGKANWSYTLDEPTQGRIAVRLRLGTALEWCTDVPAGANSASDRVDFFRGKRKTPAPAACPPVPAGV